MNYFSDEILLNISFEDNCNICIDENSTEKKKLAAFYVHFYLSNLKFFLKNIENIKNIDDSETNESKSNATLQKYITDKQKELLLNVIEQNKENEIVANLLISTFRYELIHEWINLYEYLNTLCRRHTESDIKVAALISSQIISEIHESEIPNQYNETITSVLFHCFGLSLYDEAFDLLARLFYTRTDINHLMGSLQEALHQFFKMIVDKQNDLANKLSIPICAIFETGHLSECCVELAIYIIKRNQYSLPVFWILNSVIYTYPDRLECIADDIINLAYNAMLYAPTKEDILYFAETLEHCSIYYPDKVEELLRRRLNTENEESSLVSVTSLLVTIEHIPSIITSRTIEIVFLALMYPDISMKRVCIDVLKECILFSRVGRDAIFNTLIDMVGCVDYYLLKKVIDTLSLLLERHPIQESMIGPLIDRIFFLITPLSLAYYLCSALVFSAGTKILPYADRLFLPILDGAKESPDVDCDLKDNCIEALSIITKKDDQYSSFISVLDDSLNYNKKEVNFAVFSAITNTFKHNVKKSEDIAEHYTHFIQSTLEMAFNLVNAEANFQNNKVPILGSNEDKNEEEQYIEEEEEESENNNENVYSKKEKETFVLCCVILIKRLYKTILDPNNCIHWKFCSDFLFAVLETTKDDVTSCQCILAIAHILTKIQNHKEKKFIEERFYQILSINMQPNTLAGESVLETGVIFMKGEAEHRLFDELLSFALSSFEDISRKRDPSNPFVRIIEKYLSTLSQYRPNKLPMSLFKDISSRPRFVQKIILHCIQVFLKTNDSRKDMIYSELLEALKTLSSELASDIIRLFIKDRFFTIPDETLERLLKLGGEIGNSTLLYFSHVYENNHKDTLIPTYFNDIINTFDCLQNDSNRIINFICSFLNENQDIRQQYWNQIIDSFVDVLTDENEASFQAMKINEKSIELLFNLISTMINENRECHVYFLSIMRDDRKIKIFNRRTKITVHTPCKGPIYI